MAYEERIVGDRLCWRTSPENEWTPFAATEVTSMLLDYKYKLEVSNRALDVLKKELLSLLTK